MWIKATLRCAKRTESFTITAQARGHGRMFVNVPQLFVPCVNLGVKV